MNIFLSMAVISVFAFVLGFTIGKRKKEEEHIYDIAVDYGQKGGDQTCFVKRRLSDNKIVSVEFANADGCNCDRCGVPITPEQADYDHRCARCSYRYNAEPTYCACNKELTSDQEILSGVCRECQ